MFQSILYPAGQEPEFCREEPDCFRDLNLDQVFAPILKKEEKYDLGLYFYTPLHSRSAVLYRQDVLKDLEKKPAYEAFQEFSGEIYALGRYMETCREDAESRDPWKDNYLNEGRILQFAERYCRAVEQLLEKTGCRRPESAGLTGFLDFLQAYAASENYQKMSGQVRNLRSRFSALRYCMMIHNGTIRVKKYEGEEDLSRQVVRLFEKFRQGDVEDYRQKFSDEPHANHVEAGVLSCLSRIFPEEFRDLDRFCREFLNFIHPVISRFSREIRFYLSWLNYISEMEEYGLPACCPAFPERKDSCRAEGFYDLALARKIGAGTVTNSFLMTGPERIIVVTGPNQGGKTTFARAVGQLFYLGSLGLSVPGSRAELFLPDHILTHFEREEDLSTLNGKLEDELERLRTLLEKAGKDSVIIINEIFSSTTLRDAELLGKHMMDTLAARGALCVVVTFLDELAEHGKETVSMMSLMQEGRRTFRIARKPPDGLAYAQQAAERYGLTYEKLRGRIRP